MLLLVGVAGTLGAIGPAPAGTGPGMLYSIRQDGVLRSLDPLTGAVRTTVTLSAPGRVVQFALGLAVDPQSGDLMALVDFADDCEADPTRTRFLRPTEHCYDLEAAECETAWESAVQTGTPTSCVWNGSTCRACDAIEGCVNTCLPLPPCAGTVRSDFAGVGDMACRQHDGDQTSCGSAYHVGPAGPAACFFEDGLCLGCDPLAEAAGRCQRDCAPPVACADETRTVYAGGTAAGCYRFGADPDACALAYVGYDGASRCAYDEGCYVGSVCESSPGPICPADPSRSAIFEFCSTLGDDQSACETSVALEDDGLAWRGCYFADDLLACRSCSPIEQAERTCFDPCHPPVCEEDPARTLAGIDEIDCRAFDGDAGACTSAFVQGRCGPAACVFEPANGECRACAPGDPGACANACGAFDVPSNLTLVRVDPATGAAMVVREIAGWFDDLGIDSSGTPYSVALGGCFEGSFLHDLAPTRERPASLFDVARGDGLAFDSEGGLNRMVQGPLALARYDVATGEHTTHGVVSLQVPLVGFTYVPGCDAFIVSEVDGTLSRVEPNGAVRPVAYRLVDGLDTSTGMGLGWIGGMAASPDAACPPETPIVTTTTTTTIPHDLLAGRRLLLTARPGRPAKRRMVVVAKDAGITLGRGEGSPDDPTAAGASLRVRATSGGFDVTYDLDGRWHRLSRRGEVRGWRWRGPAPIKSVVLKRGRLLRIVGRGADLGHSLFSDPAGVAVELVLGQRPYCLEFGGDVRESSLSRFEARDAPAPSICEAASSPP
jgi:hypothetical protein